MSGGQDAPFGARLRQVREAAGLSQKDLAARAGLSAKGISDLERGARRRTHPQTVRALADALELSEDERFSLGGRTLPRRSGVPAASAVVPESALPAPSSPLVGRERDLEEIMGSLRRKVIRLITLTGAGRVGKTRLALEVARHAGKSFPDGVAFIVPAPLSDAGLVIPTVAHSLALRETAGQMSREALRYHLREKRLLLLLENFEHLIEAAPEVAGLIERQSAALPWTIDQGHDEAALRLSAALQRFWSVRGYLEEGRGGRWRQRYPPGLLRNLPYERLHSTGWGVWRWNRAIAR